MFSSSFFCIISGVRLLHIMLVARTCVLSHVCARTHAGLGFRKLMCLTADLQLTGPRFLLVLSHAESFVMSPLLCQSSFGLDMKIITDVPLA